MPERKRRKRRPHTTQPHDALVKRVFSQREHAAGLLKATLAPEVVALIRWETLRLEKIHFVDRRLRGRYADLLFSAQTTEGRIYAYVLIEHQSSVEPLMIFRMSMYMWRHWEQLYRDAPGRKDLPAIYPILIHHSATGWTAATAFEDVIAVPEAARAALRPYIPRFAMKVVDVSHNPAGGLVGRALTDLGRLVLWCLSVAGDDERFEREVGQFVGELNGLWSTPEERDAILALMEYLVITHKKLGAEKIVNLLEATARKGQKEVNVDVLDELKREGRQEGRQEGREEGRREGRREGREEGELRGRAKQLLELLAERLGPVPAEARARVLAADGRTLSRWALRMLSATTFAEVFDDSPPAKPTKPTKKPATPAKRTAGKRARAA